MTTYANLTFTRKQNAFTSTKFGLFIARVLRLELFFEKCFIKNIFFSCLLTIRHLGSLDELSKILEHRHSLTKEATESKFLEKSSTFTNTQIILLNIVLLLLRIPWTSNVQTDYHRHFKPILRGCYVAPCNNCHTS